MKTLTLKEYSDGKTKPWSMANEIKARVDRESEMMIDDSDRYEIPPFHYVKVKGGWDAGWYNFVKGLLP